MEQYKRIAVKIGSNVLTRPDGTLDVTRMSALVDQVAELRRRGIDVIMISSGAVASGRSEMHLNTEPDSVSARQLFSAVGQAKLINRYYEFFRDHGIHCGQVLTTKENFIGPEQYANQQHCMATMLNAGVIPIVNENDTVSISELMFTDNDELSGLIARMMEMELLVLLSNIDGVFDGDPRQPGARLIPTITPADNMEHVVRPSKSAHGRGGMTSKYSVAREVSAEGIAVVIANGKRPNILPELLDHPETTPHTIFLPAQ